MHKKISSVLGVILSLSIILIIIFFLWALKHPDYKLKVNNENQDKVIELLKKSYKDIELKGQIEKIERKQLKGEAELYIHYYKEKNVDIIVIDDGEEIGNYIIQHGENIDLFFEIILKFLVGIIPIDILLIVVNEISYMITKRKSKIS